MKISYNWLKDYVDHNLDPEALGEMLTMSGLEVEEIIVEGASLEGVVVGRVATAEQHPNADRLRVCTVDVGAEELLHIVCGAPNVAAGQTVPVATIGTTLMLPDRDNPGEKVAIKIKKSKIRGELSQGMICAEDELGLSGDHAGIMVLDEAATIGEDFVAYLAARNVVHQDHVIDIAITPNRPDAISHIGAARDIAALVDTPLKKPVLALPEAGGAAADQVEVTIEAPEACPRYVAMVVRGVTIKESPAWLKQRLLAIGLRPRNNVVDITNYVMFECGQPLHAFDYDQIAGKKIIVRYAGKKEKFTTLDDKERELPDQTLMICDGDRSVAVAGVMGGQNSEVTDETVNVLIESAYFDPSTIRRTAKALGLQTDASYRFERGVDSDGQVWAARRAAELIAALGDGTIVDGMVDAHPAPVEMPVVSLRHKRVGQIIGHEIAAEEIERLLKAIGFGVEVAGSGNARTYTCTVPSFRPDVAREIDIIEEVARLYGYNSVPEPAQTAIPSITPHVVKNTTLRGNVRGVLAGLGYRETFTNSMVRKEVAELFNVPILTGQEGDVVYTLKPISQEMAALRPSMLPGLLTVMAYNQNHGQRVLRFMEFGHVFKKGDKKGAVVAGYAEQTSLLMVMSGLAQGANWDAEARDGTFHDLKGEVFALLAAMGVSGITGEANYSASPVTAYHLTLARNGKRVGVIARLSAEQQEAYGLKTPVYFAEINWDVLFKMSAGKLSPKYVKISRFPAVDRDLAVIVNRDQDVGGLSEAISRAGGNLLQEVSVFDVYQGERVAADKKSVAFGLRFGAHRTLKDKEVDAKVKAVIKALNDGFGAELRQ
ncbi:MAG: phenylalanine--tRNA ligase subunit beta [Bacteroidota bacterium]